MKWCVRYLRSIVLFAAILLFSVAGSLQGRAVHATMITGEIGSAAMSTPMSMPMDHSAPHGMPESREAICKLKCLAVVMALPVLFATSGSPDWTRFQGIHTTLLTTGYQLAPDRPPPKSFVL